MKPGARSSGGAPQSCNPARSRRFPGLGGTVRTEHQAGYNSEGQGVVKTPRPRAAAGMTPAPAALSATTGGDIHRIGGGGVENLRLKPREAGLDVPGISV